MPLSTISASVMLEKNKLSPAGALLLLLELTFLDDSIVRLARNTESVSWAGHEWIAFPFEIDDIEDKSDGEIPEINIRVSNVTRALQTYLESSNGAVGATVKLILVHINELVDYTSYDETDTDGSITVASNLITLNGYDGSPGYLEKEFGTEVIQNNFAIRWDMQIDSADADSLVCPILFSKAAGTVEDLEDDDEDFLKVAYQKNENGILLVERNGTDDQDTDAIAMSLGSRYYLELERITSIGSFGRAYLRVYSDSTFTTLVDEVFLDLTENSAWTYFYPLNNYGDGDSADLSGTIRNHRFATPHTAPEFEIELEILKAEADENWVVFTLGSFNPFNYRFPRNRVIANHCRWRNYKGIECMVANAGAETCDRTLATCRLRSNSERFGNCPGVGGEGIYI